MHTSLRHLLASIPLYGLSPFLLAFAGGMVGTAFHCKALDEEFADNCGGQGLYVGIASAGVVAPLIDAFLIATPDKAPAREAKAPAFTISVAPMLGAEGARWAPGLGIAGRF